MKAFRFCVLLGSLIGASTAEGALVWSFQFSDASHTVLGRLETEGNPGDLGADNTFAGTTLLFLDINPEPARDHTLFLQNKALTSPGAVEWDADTSTVRVTSLIQVKANDPFSVFGEQVLTLSGPALTESQSYTDTKLDSPPHMISIVADNDMLTLISVVPEPAGMLAWTGILAAGWGLFRNHAGRSRRSPPGIGRK